MMDTVMANVPGVEIVSRIDSLEKALDDLRNLTLNLQKEVFELRSQIGGAPAIAICPPCPTSVCGAKPAVCPAKPAVCPAKPASCPAPAKPAAKEDDDVDLFASDSEEDDEAATKIKEQRLAEYAAKKSKKPVLIAKSSIILDVKPWDDETDMQEMEKLVRKIETDGLLWGASKLVPLAYGIMKLQISCVVEDEKVSVDWLQEEIEKLEDLVQSVDIAAFNKI